MSRPPGPRRANPADLEPLLEALRAAPQGATAVDLSIATGIHYHRVLPILRDLKAQGRAAFEESSDAATGFRRTWRLTAPPPAV